MIPLLLAQCQRLMGAVAVECQGVKLLLFCTAVDTHLYQNMDRKPQEYVSAFFFLIMAES